MNPQAPMPAIQSFKQCARITFAISYNLINTASLILCIHLTTIIRSDGPSGFGELIIKAFILNLSLVFFCAGIILSFKQYRAVKKHLTYILTSFLIALLLAFFAVLGVIEACNNSKGYCRNWQLVSIEPNNRFKSLASLTGTG
jgi:cell division protein FtsW (lipid II flippase)